MEGGIWGSPLTATSARRKRGCLQSCICRGIINRRIINWCSPVMMLPRFSLICDHCPLHDRSYHLKDTTHKRKKLYTYISFLFCFYDFRIVLVDCFFGKTDLHKRSSASQHLSFFRLQEILSTVSLSFKSQQQITLSLGNDEETIGSFLKSIY